MVLDSLVKEVYNTFMKYFILGYLVCFIAFIILIAIIKPF